MNVTADWMWTALMITLCATAISFTITTTGMFLKFREIISAIHPKLEDLIHCPWCLGHWIVFIILLTSDNFEPLALSRWYLYNWLFTAFAIIAPMGLMHYVLLRSYKPVSRYLMERKISMAKARAQMAATPPGEEN